MTKRVYNIIITSLMLLLLLATYVSGALLALVGIGYVSAIKNNPDSVADYTKTASFRRVTGEYMDALYASVTGDEPLKMPYDDDIAFFAYGLDTNRVYCSDKTLSDMPSFEGHYMDSEAYPYYLRYSYGKFRGNSKASGVAESFEYIYTDAASTVFNNEQKYYSDAAMVIAVLPPDYGLTGYSYSRVEFALLKNGAQILFIALGIFLICLSALLSIPRRRRQVDKLIASIFTGVFCEIKLGAVALVVWFALGHLVRGNLAAFTTLSVLTLIPCAYITYCCARYQRGKFFKMSLLDIGYSLAKELYDTVAPVSEPRVRFRRRAITLMVFGVVFPVLFFILADVVFGLQAVRISIGVYVILFCLVEIYLFRCYGKLLNDVCNLTSLTSVFALGARLPETNFKENDDIRQLADNISHFDDAVDAAAEMKFRKSSKHFHEMSASLEEMKMQIDILQDMISDLDEESTAHIRSRARHIASLMDEMQTRLLQDTPIAAPVLKRIDLLDVMDDVLNAKIAEFSAARLKLKVDIPDPPAYITADYAHIKSALDILFTNTAMYAASGTEVEISLKKDGQNWVYTVENDESPYAHSGTAGSAISTGLTMAREYISINGGTLTKRSENGRYSVTVSLPAAR